MPDHVCALCGQSNRLLIPLGDGRLRCLNPDRCKPPPEVSHGGDPAQGHA